MDDLALQVTAEDFGHIHCGFDGIREDIAAINAHTGDEFGEWGPEIEVTQAMINDFADLTGDLRAGGAALAVRDRALVRPDARLLFRSRSATRARQALREMSQL